MKNEQNHPTKDNLSALHYLFLLLITSGFLIFTIIQLAFFITGWADGHFWGACEKPFQRRYEYLIPLKPLGCKIGAFLVKKV